MHTYNIRIMISTIYAEDREDMESIFVSKNSAIIKQEKNIAYVYASLVVGFMNYFPFRLWYKRDRDRIRSL